MSMRPLLTAVQTRLQSYLTLTDKECLIMADGRPPASCGQKFYSVHSGNMNNGSMSRQVLDALHGFSVTLTLRCAHIPPDRLGDELIAKATTGLWALVDGIIDALHQDYTSMGTANTDLGALVNGFLEPQTWVQSIYLGARDPSWFWSMDESDQLTSPTGLAVEIQFADAKRVQKLLADR